MAFIAANWVGLATLIVAILTLFVVVKIGLGLQAVKDKFAQFGIG